MNLLSKLLNWTERQISITEKIAIPLLTIGVLTATVLSINTVAATRRQIDRNYRTQARQVANVVQADFNARSADQLNDQAAINAFLQQLQHSDPTILSIHIYRMIKREPVLWAASDWEQPIHKHEVHDSDLEPILTGASHQDVENNAKLETIVPLRIGTDLASLSIYTSLQPRHDAVQGATRTIVFTSALGISAQTAALMGILYWTVLRRIQLLSQAALQVARGDTAVRLLKTEIPAGQDEILNVTREFDRMLRAVQRRSQYQDALAELGQQALEEIDAVELLHKVVQLVVRTLEVHAADIAELSPDLSSLQIRIGADWAENNIEVSSLPIVSSAPLEQTVQTHIPTVIEKVAAEPDDDRSQLLQAQGVISSISVLIANFDQPFGILSAHSKTQRLFLKDEVDFLQAVASLIAAAIDRQRIEIIMTQAEAALARAEAAESAQQALEKEILERQRIETALRESEERYILAANGANDGLWDWDLHSNKIYFSSRWKAMLGYADTEIGSHPNEWFDRIHPDDYEAVQMEIWHHREGLTAHFESEFRLRQKNGSYCWMLSRGLAVRDSAGNVYRMAGSQTDVTARKSAEAQLIHNALHDELTGLANRTLFTDRLERAIACNSRYSKTAFAVLFLDLDRFKVINDSLGHLVGDQLLLSTAERLQRCLRSSDTCARLGGDEFAILIEDLQAAGDALTLADRIQAELKAPFVLAGQEVFVDSSMGIVIDTHRYTNKEALLRDADTAMYRSKATGRGCRTVFTPEMHEQAVTLLHLEADLRRAIERQELRLHYQPILALSSQRLTGFEALLRWQHPQRGLLLPADFIAVAEETGLMISIGWWVLQSACRQMRQWQEFDLDPSVTISVNLSAKQFAQPDLVPQIAKILQTTELSPQRLKLEITENVIMTNADAAAETMLQLKRIGVQLAMDDFGTGYSSLSYLHRFPIDTLKIDRSFINSAGDDLEKLEITRTVIALAWNLGMDVVAEGVETERQMAQLKLLKCELAQGFLFSQPLDPETTSMLLTQGKFKQIYQV